MDIDIGEGAEEKRGGGGEETRQIGLGGKATGVKVSRWAGLIAGRLARTEGVGRRQGARRPG